jgi:hypothetical protein
MKYGVGVLHNNLLSKRDFRENSLSDPSYFTAKLKYISPQAIHISWPISTKFRIEESSQNAAQ